MPVFGSDPDAPVKEWEETPAPVVRPGKNVYVLVNYFGYHPKMRMDQRFNDQDRSIVASYFSRKIKAGLSPDELRSLVDKFYSSPHSHSNFPALSFVKNEVQEELVQDDVDVSISDPVLQWLVDGMPNTCDQITDTRESRRLVLLHSDESLMRYPEVVAAIIGLDDTEEPTIEMLSALERLVMWNLEEFDDDTRQLQASLARVSLPPELATSMRSPSRIRIKQSTMKQAVLSIPTKRDKETW